MKRVFLLLLSCFLLTGCSFFNKTYVVNIDYTLPERKEAESEDSVNIQSISELRDAIRNAVADGATNRTVIFDSDFNGSPSESLAAACWQVRTEDALCAYCVENIAYEISQIVSYTEARITITYSRGALPVESIINMPYATSLNEVISEAISSGDERLAILISRSTLTAETMAGRCEEVYQKNPGLAPVEPECSVTLFSGSGTQRLYEINLHYGLTQTEFTARKAELDEVILPFDEDADEVHKALMAAEFLLNAYDPEGGNSIYDALVLKKANSKGIALGYVDLCRQAGLDCRIVAGQREWQDYDWNIVRIDGGYYHVDLTAGIESGFLKSDASFWGNYRWTINEYPACSEDYPMDMASEESETELQDDLSETPAEIE